MIHHTAMASAAEAVARLCDPVAEVSAHWLVEPDGTAHALVPEARRAWHAGAGRWGDATDVNSRSVGIELQNRGDHPFAAPQMAALERLLGGVMGRWGIPPERVIGHSDMAPERKSDPGPRFDWRRLARAGLSVWPGRGEEGALRAGLVAFGYDSGLSDEWLLRAFRLRFRPWAEGPEGEEDRRLACDLGRRWPVDRGAPPA